MAVVLIENLPSIGSVEGADILPIVDVSGSPVTSQVTVETLGTFIADNYGAGGALEGNAVGTINMASNELNLGTGTGGSGGTLKVDSGQIMFADINGTYDNAAIIRTGTFGTYGGISLVCFVGFEMNWQAGILNLPGPINSSGGQINLNGGTLAPDNESSLSTDNSGNWTISATSIAGMPSVAVVSQTLTSDNDGQTLGITPALYWVNNSSPFTVFLPPVAQMTNRSVKFVCTQQISEQWLDIQVNADDAGPPQIQQAGTNFNMDGFSTVEFTSDGTNWWITGGYNEGAF